MNKTVTPDTITEDQISELRDEALEVYVSASRALGFDPRGFLVTSEDSWQARIRCVEILNDRTKRPNE